jgi:ubiquinone/menaquinone biosynthesis C-methylase UbiE
MKQRLQMGGFEFSRSFDRVADIYDKTRSLPSEVMKGLVRVLSVELKDCMKILDVGVGTGRIAEPLQNAGFEVFGIDISRKMTSKAKEKGVKQLLLADARFLPFKPNTFDAAICVHVLHLISEWRKALEEICQVSRFAMFSLYDVHENPVREAYGQLLQQYGYERHRPGISERELEDLSNLAKSLFVSSYDVYADDSLSSLEQRASSSQWEIPGDVNFKIVEDLKTKFAGKIFKQELYLLAWDINSLKIYTNNLQDR